MANRFPLGVALPAASDICSSVRTGIRPNALELLKPGMTVGEYLTVLVTNSLYVDALRMMAYSMPTRYALWWGYRCLGLVVDKMSHAERDALEAVRRWVLHPDDAQRVATERTGSIAPLDSAASFLARSASYVGIALPKPKYGTPQNFPAKGIFSSLWIATSLVDQPDPLMRKFLEIGLDVSQGKDVWPAASS